jgi:hypothetical protein
VLTACIIRATRSRAAVNLIQQLNCEHYYCNKIEQNNVSIWIFFISFNTPSKYLDRALKQTTSWSGSDRRFRATAAATTILYYYTTNNNTTSSHLIMKAESYAETSVNFCQTTWRKFPEDSQSSSDH